MSARSEQGGVRWQPVRAGLVNVWRFQEEIFTFHRGRLLLRGPNGSGKSMALELLFPFLLDADASPFKLSSSPKTRGGLYDRVMTGEEGSTRVGFAWVELRKQDEVFTAGVRLRASRSTRRVDTDWFTADLAVGAGLSLLDRDRVPVGKAALAQALDGRGRVHDTAQDYRAAVRARLFPGFSAAQYDGLVSALLVLRREKISQDLDPVKLSDILTASLPPLDEKDLSEVAEGFERLDRRKDDLARLEGDRDQIEALARRQRRYAQVVLVREANQVRSAETGRDAVTRAEREARSVLSQELAELEQLRAEDIQAKHRSEELVARLGILRNLDAYREGRRLEGLRQESGRLETALRRSRDTMSHREQEHQRAHDRRGASGEAHVAALANEARARADADQAADPLLAAQALDEASRMDDPDEAEAFVDLWVTARRHALDEVRAALARLESSVRDRDMRDRQVEEERERLTARTADAEHAERMLVAAREAYRAAVGEWAAGCVILDRLRLRAELPVPADDPAAVLVVVRGMAHEGIEALAAARARTSQAIDETGAQAGMLEAERDELVAGRTPEPEPPVWRSDRSERPERSGAPLWRLVDFTPECGDGDREGIEAALLASGLLDAWLSPDGSVVLPSGQADVLLDPFRQPAAEPTLARVLVPLAGTDVPTEMTARLLDRVALAASAAGRSEDAVVGRDGTFRLSALAGRGLLRPAAFIGATAQEQERARRIAVIDAMLGTLARQLQQLRADLDDHDRRRRTLDAEVQAVPGGSEVEDAVLQVELCADRVADAESRLKEADARRARAEEDVRRAQQGLMRLAAQHSLPTDSGALVAVGALLESLDRANRTWAERRRASHRAAHELVRAEQELERARAELDRARKTLEEDDGRHREVSAQLAALTASIGSAYEDVVSRIGAAEAEGRELRSRREEINEASVALGVKVGQRKRDVEQAARRREEAEAARDEAHASLVAALGDGFGDDSGFPVDPGMLTGLTGVLEVARTIAARYPTLDTERPAVSRARNAVHELVQVAMQSLRGRVDITFEETGHEWWLLRAATDGVRTRVPQLVARLAEEIELARAELTEEEQRLFDETLTGSVRASVADRIRSSGALVDQINRALAGVRTEAAGVQVRLQWEVDPEQPQSTRFVRALLLKDAAAYGEEDRKALHQFFRGRIEEVRSDLEGAAGWEERLREVLDYRRWHRFALGLAHRDWQGFEPATSARLQRLSTGERSIALHLPMLASIAAHYDGQTNGERQPCPRLIVLDELFAGVDQANRAQLFGLMAAWDLDAVFTSDHEWCKYSTLDGIAIHHLHATDRGSPVVSTRFVWDGRRSVAASADLVPAGAGTDE